ncbi:MAG TPA: hypothetical protein VIE91_08980 [Methylophilaceae bacterium]|jgi:hypothetical protein
MKVLLLLALLLGISSVQAEEWQLLGPSEAGDHYVDRDSLRWDPTQTIFRIVTNVQLYDDTVWLTELEVDCQQSSYAYISGVKMLGNQVLSRFDKPKAPEPISQESMPDQLRNQYCYSDIDLNVAQWESVGKSSIAEVFFDRTSIKQSKDKARFVAETRVVPFNGDEETLSTLVFSCSDHTFTLLKANRVKDGKLQPIFDKPQRATPTSKTATLDKLSSKFCGSAK